MFVLGLAYSEHLRRGCAHWLLPYLPPQGTEAWLDLELKVVADCGIIGVPNAGALQLPAHCLVAMCLPCRIADATTQGAGRDWVMENNYERRALQLSRLSQRVVAALL